MDGACKKDSFSKEQNDTLNLFLKLFRHYSLGGFLVCETQSRDDLHYSFDRNINVCSFIFKAINLPFFRLVKIRDLLYTNNVQNNFNTDVSQASDYKWFLVPKHIFKTYDSFYYERLTKDLPVFDDLDKFKINGFEFVIPTLHEYKEISDYNKSVLRGDFNE